MKQSILDKKNLVLGVCGAIAAYKSVALLRLLVKAGALVRVVMTENAGRFVGALTFEALSRNKVCSDLFDFHDTAAVQHIQWARDADAVIVAPATANTIAKLAHGIADDGLSTFMLAVTSPAMICPSMNANMYASEAVQDNLEILRRRGYAIVEPEAGELACGTIGPGRLPEPEYILDRLHALLMPKDLSGYHFLITAGPTHEPIDPVRYISNRSSGKMGYAIARAAEMRGADVTLVSGPTILAPPNNVRLVPVTTAAQMAVAVSGLFEKADILIKSAAVADYTPERTNPHKIKKRQKSRALPLKPTEDILKQAAQQKHGQVMVGFAAETQHLDRYAAEKLASKRLDLIVGNLVGPADSGFEVDTNRVNLYFKEGPRESLGLMPKREVAHLILDRVVDLLKGKSR